MKIESFPSAVPEVPRDTRLREYPEDFGNKALQEMIDDLLLEEFQGITDIQSVSRWDDQREHVDRVVATEQGVRFASDYTGTLNEKTMREKALEFLQKPAVQLHDDRGRVIDPEWLLRVVMPVDIKRWGGAYSRFLTEGGGSPIDHLTNKDQEALAIAYHVVRQLSQLPKSLRELKKPRDYVEGLVDLTQPVLEFFEGQIKLLKEKRQSSIHAK